jgi:hypothetical protein
VALLNLESPASYSCVRIRSEDEYLEADADLAAPKSPPTSRTAVPRATLAVLLNHGWLCGLGWNDWSLSSLLTSALT